MTAGAVTFCVFSARVDEAKQWAIGDWLVDGKRHYGDGLYDRAAEITGLSESILQTYKSMSDSFELCLRKQDLGYSHHKEVASIKQIVEKGGKLGGVRGDATP